MVRQRQLDCIFNCASHNTNKYIIMDNILLAIYLSTSEFVSVIMKMLDEKEM